MRRGLAALLALCLLCLAACGNKDRSGYIVSYDLTAAPRSLDPQLASSSESLMIIENTFEGLLRQSATGELVPGVATGYTVSDDGLTYSFTLRNDAMWSDGKSPAFKTPVTADDFVFAFQRVVSPETGSPAATGFLCIQNARQILKGELPAERLGVSAPDAHTLVVKLETRNPFFAETVTTAAAMPCNREFFSRQKGRYGLEPDYLIYNGPFYIKNYDENSRLRLRANSDYRSGVPAVAGGVDLNFQFDDKYNSEKPNAKLKTGGQKLLERFYTGKTDAAPISYSDVEPLKKENKAEIYSFENKVWGLLFNCSSNTYGSEKIRRALMLSVDSAELAPYLTGNLAPAHAIVPPAVKLLDKPYREIAGGSLRPARDPAAAKALLEEGFAALGIEKLSKNSIIFPQDGGFSPMLSILQRQLQETLGVFINLEPLPMETLAARVRSGDYLLAVAPFTAERNNPDAVLSCFASYSTQNVSGYFNAQFDAVLARAMVAEGIAQAASLYKTAESILMESAAFLPLAYETTHYAAAPQVKGLVFSPFSYNVFFKFAYSEK